jgi:hypothetical protein
LRVNDHDDAEESVLGFEAVVSAVETFPCEEAEGV